MDKFVKVTKQRRADGAGPRHASNNVQPSNMSTVSDLNERVPPVLREEQIAARQAVFPWAVYFGPYTYDPKGQKHIWKCAFCNNQSLTCKVPRNACL